jgi:WD40 repeat protein
MIRRRDLWKTALLAGLIATSAVHAQEERPWGAKSITTFKKHTLPVRSAQLSPDGRVVASVASDNRNNELRLWDAETGKELVAPPSPKGYVQSLTFSGNSRCLLIVGSADQTALIWDLAKNEVVGAHSESRTSTNTVALNYEGSRYATAGYQSIGLWEAKTGNSAMIARPKQSVGGGTFSPDLKRYAFPNSQDIDLWDVTTGKEMKIFGEHRGVVKRVAFSRDGKTLVAASVRSTGYYKWIGQVKFWDIATGKDRWTLAADTRLVTAIDLSPDEKTLALLEYPEIDGKTELLLADVASGKATFRLKDPTVRFQSPVFLKDNWLRVIGIKDGKVIHVWEILPLPD